MDPDAPSERTPRDSIARTINQLDNLNQSLLANKVVLWAFRPFWSNMRDAWVAILLAFYRIWAYIEAYMMYFSYL